MVQYHTEIPVPVIIWRKKMEKKNDNNSNSNVLFHQQIYLVRALTISASLSLSKAAVGYIGK